MTPNGVHSSFLFYNLTANIIQLPAPVSSGAMHFTAVVFYRATAGH